MGASGALALPGAPLLTIEREGAYRLEASVEESRLSAIRVGQPVSVTLTRMRLTSATAPGDAPLTAVIQLGERVGQKQFATYTFTNVPAGKTYRVFPAGFRAQPRDRTVECRPNATHGEQHFRIVGPTSG